MSNNNEIYPLDKEFVGSYGIRIELSVNERLRPIFKALLRDPNGWEKEWFRKYGGEWYPAISELLPLSHESCEVFRLVRKPKTITVEIPMPDGLGYADGQGTPAIHYHSGENRKITYEAIRKAMEGE